MKFDIAIIGAGPGGYNAAEKAAKMGMELVLFEKEDLGGTCLNRGCMPTKALIHSAEVYESALHADSVGVIAKEVGYDFAAMHALRNYLVEGLRTTVRPTRSAILSSHLDPRWPILPFPGSVGKASTTAVTSWKARV